MKVYEYYYVDCDTPSNKGSYKLFKERQDWHLSKKEIRKNFFEEKQIVARLFKEHGWEGDGRIGLIWIPPFVIRNADTCGEIVWHVKQSNNGTPFIATSDNSKVNIYNYCD